MHVLATAGHVDHGKSTLIEQLTGIDPDRLAEEKARGMTIDLGFAWLRLPGGREMGIIDVPGHERFVHTMLAGAGSVDAALFVVAANEGWKPQSEEHLAILDLLETRHAVVALTKSDLVDARARDAARDDVRARLAGTALRDAAIVPVSAQTGEGLEDLLMAIEAMLDDAGEPRDAGRPRVFVDRSFSITGAGTVVTGTLTGGTLRVEDTVEILPSGVCARVRGIQTHKTTRNEAVPVSRVALNLAGVERANVRRGDTLVTPGQWRATCTIDVRLRAVRALDHSLDARGAFKAHIGSAEVGARLTLLDREELRAGESGFARISLGEAVVAQPLDRIVLRDTGRRATVAGGVVLDAHPLPLRSDGAAGAGATHPLTARARRVARLEARAASPEGIPSLTIEERGVVARADLEWLTGRAAPPPDAVELRDFVVSRGRFDDLAATIERVLEDFHARDPLARGMPREDARAATQIADPKLYAGMLDALTERVAAEGPLVRLATHRVLLDPEQERARAALLDEMHAAEFAPPGLAALEARYGAKLVRALVDSGELVKISDAIVFTREALARATQTIAEAIARDGALTASQIRELLGTSRKYAIPLLEHLDTTGVTRRNGDVRDLAR